MSTTPKTTTTTLATTTTTTTEGPLKRCPGVCLPGLMAAFCSKPSVVINWPPNLCERGSVCCDSKPRQDAGGPSESTGSTKNKPTAKPTSAFQEILSNPLTSLLAGPILSNLAGSLQKKPAPVPATGQHTLHLFIITLSSFS